MNNSRFKFRAWDKVEKIMIENITFPRDDNVFLLHTDNHIVMQSTGLQDKNGVDVYEGDILKLKNGSTGVVKYGKCDVTAEDNFCGTVAIGFYFDSPDYSQILGNPEPWSDNATDTPGIEVIGHAYTMVFHGCQFINSGIGSIA